MLPKDKIQSLLAKWNRAWEEHDLDGVMELFHEEILFENWTGGSVLGKGALRKAWEPWFKNHGGFQFMEEDTFIDEGEQKVLYQWTLDWPSVEKRYQGKREKRRGLDILHFQEGKIIRKTTYSQTTLEIEGKRVKLVAE